MFNTKDLKCLDPNYFCIIAVDDYDVTIISRNTGHYWYLHNLECPGEGSVVIFHRHRLCHPLSFARKSQYSEAGGEGD